MSEGFGPLLQLLPYYVRYCDVGAATLCTTLRFVQDGLKLPMLILSNKLCCLLSSDRAAHVSCVLVTGRLFAKKSRLEQGRASSILTEFY